LTRFREDPHLKLKGLPFAGGDEGVRRRKVLADEVEGDAKNAERLAIINKIIIIMFRRSFPGSLNI
jgi:hypothetical protein